MNNKVFFSFVVLLVFTIFIINGCSLNKTGDKPNGEIDSNREIAYFQPGELVRVSGHIELNLQKITVLPYIQLLSQEAKFESLPHIYYRPDQHSIVRIREDGNTVYTSIEMADSSNYEVAYIVEKTDSEKHTNAPYTIDIKENRIYPKASGKSFALVHLHITNISRNDLPVSQLSLSIQADHGELMDLDSILSETILYLAPDILIKPGETRQVQWLALVPSDSSSLLLTVEERKIEWKRNED